MPIFYTLSLFWFTQAIAVQGALAEAMTVKPSRPTLVLIIGGKA